MDFVDDYQTKSQRAAALRKYQEGLMGQKFDTSPIQTAASGAFPGQTGINYGGPLAMLGTAFLNRNAGANADAAETEAKNSRLQAINQIMAPTPAPAMSSGGRAAAVTGGGLPQPGPAKMDASKMLQLEQLGVDPAMMKLIMPKEHTLGAISQAAATPQGRQALVQMGVWTPEQAAQADAAEKTATSDAAKAERDKYTFEQGHKVFAPPAPRTPSEFEMYQKDPAAYAAYQEAKNAGKPGAGGTTTGRYDPAREAAKLNSAADEIEGMINLRGSEMFGVGQTAAAGARKYGEENANTVLGQLTNALGTKTESPENSTMRRLGIESMLESIAKMAPASDTDVRTLLSTMPNAFQSEEGARAFVGQMRVIVDNVNSGRYNAAPTAAPAVDSEDAAAMEWAKANPDDPRAAKILGGR